VGKTFLHGEEPGRKESIGGRMIFKTVLRVLLWPQTPILIGGRTLVLKKGRNEL